MPRIHPVTGLFRALIAPTTLRAAAATTTSMVSRAPTLLTALRPTPTPTRFALIPSPSPSLSLSRTSPILSQLRFGSYGAEYQPSQRKRKRKHGFLARQKRGGKDGLAMIGRRRKHGRRFLSH